MGVKDVMLIIWDTLAGQLLHLQLAKTNNDV